MMVMFTVLILVLAGILAVLAPRYGVDSRPDFSRRADKFRYGA